MNRYDRNTTDPKATGKQQDTSIFDGYRNTETKRRECVGTGGELSLQRCPLTIGITSWAGSAVQWSLIQIDECVELFDGGADPEHGVGCGGLASGSVVQRGEQQVNIIGLQAFQDAHRSGSGFSDYPGGCNAARVPLTFEGEAVELPAVGSPVAVTLDTQASASEVFDYWWRGGIPNVRYYSD